MSDLDAIRAHHISDKDPDFDEAEFCADCGHRWPCDTAIVLAALDEIGVAGLVIKVKRERDEALARERRLREALEFDDVRDCWTISRADYDALAETSEDGP